MSKQNFENKSVISIQDCSTYNPCGNRGYCTDNATLVGDTWQCECKYWWEGKICDIRKKIGNIWRIEGFIIPIF